jgi:hypothetical protein
MKKQATGPKSPADDYASDADTVPNLSNISLEDTSTQIMRGVPPPKATGVVGYNPYDTYPNGSSTATNRGNEELRRLSDWIRQKRQAEKLKADEGAKQDDQD